MSDEPDSGPPKRVVPSLHLTLLFFLEKTLLEKLPLGLAGNTVFLEPSPPWGCLKAEVAFRNSKRNLRVGAAALQFLDSPGCPSLMQGPKKASF